MAAEKQAEQQGKKEGRKRKGDDDAANTLVAKTIDATPAGASEGSPRIAVSEHPRASRFVRDARGVAGLGGFLVGTWMSLGTHALAEALLRGLIAGVACQLVVWAAAVLLCRHLIVAEIKSREHALMEAAAARLEASRRGVGAEPQVRAPIQGRAAPIQGRAR